MRLVDRRYQRFVLIALATLATSACGFIFVNAPPTGHEQMTSFSCTESNAGPVLDIVWGGLNVIGALAAAGDPDAYVNSDQIIAVGLAWGALSGAAAGVGFGKTRRCREARRLLLARQGPGPTVAPVTQPVPAPAAVTVTPPTGTVRVGGTLQLVAAAYSSSGATIPSASFAWSSSNDAIASVSAAGLVAATAPGTVVIAARSGTTVGTANLTVMPN